MKGIIAYGDSIVRGVSFDNGKYRHNTLCFINLLGERLNIPIENRGKMGRTVMQLENTIAYTSDLLNTAEYDTVFISYGGNDCDFDWQAVSERPDDAHSCKTEPDCFTHTYFKNVMHLKELGKQVYLLSLPPIDADKYFRWVSRGKDADAILHWLRGDVAYIQHWHEMFNLAVFKTAIKANVQVIDITSCFLSRAHFSEFLCDDGIHPNTDGHMIIADAILAQLR